MSHHIDILLICPNLLLLYKMMLMNIKPFIVSAIDQANADNIRIKFGLLIKYYIYKQARKIFMIVL